MKKLILEELEDEKLTMEVPTGVQPLKLTPDEEANFHVSSVSDILNNYLQAYNYLNSCLMAPEFKDDIRSILESVLEDNAIIIGKLQEALTSSASEPQQDLINQGAEEAQDIAIGAEEEKPIKEEE